MTFYLESKKNNYQAMLEYKEGIYILKKGSIVSCSVSPHFRSHRAVEKKRREAGLTSDNCVLQKDLEFSSSTVAGEFVSGSSCNGPSSWKTKHKITLKEWLSNQG